jgi:hypothetical protein
LVRNGTNISEVWARIILKVAKIKLKQVIN